MSNWSRPDSSCPDYEMYTVCILTTKYVCGVVVVLAVLVVVLVAGAAETACAGSSMPIHAAAATSRPSLEYHKRPVR